jgi:CHAT domain-containing protein
MAKEQGQLEKAHQYFADNLNFARSRQQRFLEANALLNQSAVSLLEEHFDEAADWSELAAQIAKEIGAADLEQNALGNLGWAYYKLGDPDKALDLFLKAGKRAAELDDVMDSASWKTNAGYVYLDAHNVTAAGVEFQEALRLAKSVNSKEDVYNALRALARLAVQTHDFPKALDYSEQALLLARETNSRIDELYLLLVKGQVAAGRGDSEGAEKQLDEVAHDSLCPAFLKWSAEHALARLYEARGDPRAADRQYRAAIATFETARETVNHQDLQLSFFSNAVSLYDDYVRFLVEQSRSNDALRWADYNRGRTLAEGLGLLSKKLMAEPAFLPAQAVARRDRSTLLFYKLGEKQSYLWATTERETRLFSLPAKNDIDMAVRRYSEALQGPQDVLRPANRDGLSLYQTLVAPVRQLLSRGGKVVIIPDGSLNNLNFETLLVPDPTPHFWIEDSVITNASSLRLLTSPSPKTNKVERSLLLIGNSLSPGPKYPVLPKAAAQMERVAKHFSKSQRRVLTQEDATPAAYLASKPEQFSHIHFVAHGTASRLSPLDSAIVLSKSSDHADSFKLYARDIIQHPLRADLVTISACYGAEGRQYSGEGLVGLSWAFLKAGALHVVAALWEASDAPTEELMGRFYEELDHGTEPDVALQRAKLSLLHGSLFHDPFYWAPFQLYAGSYRNADPAISRERGSLSALAKAH